MKNSASDVNHLLLDGDVRRLTLRLSTPSLLAMLSSGLSTLFDALFLSHSSSAAAAVALCFPLVTIIQTIGFTLGMGAGSFVSRSLGREQPQPAQSAASTALYIALILGGALCLLGQFFPQALLRLLGAREEAVLAAAVLYARWLLAAAIPMCASLVLSSLLRAQSYTAVSLLAYGVGCAAGTLLCWLLVVRLSLGLVGAGIALLAREGLTLLIFLLATLKCPGAIRPGLRYFSFRPQTLLNIMRSGLPTLVRQGFMSVSSVMLSRISADFGTTAVAGMGLALRAGNLVSSAIIGFGQGFQPVCGYNFGAGRLDRVKDAYRFCQRLLAIALVLLGAAGFFISPWLLSRFAPDAQTARFGAAVLRAHSALFPAQGALILMNMLTQSMGLPVRATLVAASRQGYVLIPLLLLLPRLFGETGLILAQSVSDAVSLVIGWALTRRLFAGMERTA